MSERSRRRGQVSPRPSGPAPRDYELEVIPGVEEVVEGELRATLGQVVRVVGRPRPGRIAIQYAGDASTLNRLRTIVAVHAVETFDVPRPRALLGQTNLTRLLAALGCVLARYPRSAFQTLRLSGAGSETPVFARLRNELASRLGLSVTDLPADLQVALRRPPGGEPGWQALIRTSPRPLAARAWRVCDLPGALNASVASVMLRFTRPSPSEVFLNLGCGSGTLLVERLELGPARLVVGVDLSPEALACATQNLVASGHARAAALLQADVTHLPLPSATIDTLVADLPFGMLLGSARENERLYPALLAEAARVARPQARFVAITASRRLFEETLTRFAGEWKDERTLPLKVPYRGGYITPRIYVLRRRDLPLQ